MFMYSIYREQDWHVHVHMRCRLCNTEQHWCVHARLCVCCRRSSRRTRRRRRSAPYNSVWRTCASTASSWHVTAAPSPTSWPSSRRSEASSPHQRRRRRRCHWCNHQHRGDGSGRGRGRGQGQAGVQGEDEGRNGHRGPAGAQVGREEM